MKTLAEMKDAFYMSYLENEINILTNQLQVHKAKEDKIRELIESPIDNMSLNWQSKLILQILNEGDE